MATPAGVEQLAATLQELSPQTDILGNNAGSRVEQARLLEATPELSDEVFTLNGKSAWMMARAAAGGMIARQRGWIVNLASIAARHGGGPGAALYAAAKASVSCLTKGLAKELAPFGIRGNAVSPGTVDNHFHELFSPPAMLESIRQQTPAGALGTHEEIADTIVFLCSEKARFVHG